MQLLRENLTVGIDVSRFSLYTGLSWFVFLQLWSSDESDLDNADQPDEQQ